MAVKSKGLGVGKRLFLTGALGLLALAAYGQGNPELARMYNEDQAARRSIEGQEIDWAKLNVEDAARRAAVVNVLRNGGISTAQDYYYAAMIFQHGATEEDIRLAHSFATIAAALWNDSSAPANWLMAASWDRLMMQLDKPQWYGTQYIRDDEGRWALYPVEPNAVTDEQRAALSVPLLAEAESRVAMMNGNR